ncbi:MAG: hypothetical protein EZS28_011422 [Streblomastix strix]|uniref:Uncharacterized protein n=1 Tax=Streblomastix strix TaxID=222440 RepID=A0A5J4WDI9_9EUKA|nr:MAG: hypothetical protein EZS28_011422 [Streblomastix strix]
MQERTIKDTKKKLVGIFSIMIQVFRLLHAGAGSRTIPSLKKHIARHQGRRFSWCRWFRYCCQELQRTFTYC